jgi:hypothetical protein
MITGRKSHNNDGATRRTEYLTLVAEAKGRATRLETIFLLYEAMMSWEEFDIV